MILGVVAGAVSAAPGETSLVSVSSAQVQGEGFSAPGNITPSGRFVSFFSNSTTLDPNDLDRFSDVYLRDLQTRTTTLVSVSSNGTKGNGTSAQPFVSDGGHYVSFASDATNLVPNTTRPAQCALQHVYLRDLQAGTTEMVSVSSAGTQSNCFSDAGNVSADGRFVVFTSLARNLVANDGNNASDVFVRDRQTGTTRRVSVSSGGNQGNGGSFRGEFSSDGRFVTFVSTATNLTNRDANGPAEDVFVRDLQTGTTQMVSVSSTGVQGNSVSTLSAITPGGRFVAFTSFASNLVPGDTNGAYDVFVRDRQAGTTERVSVSSTGGQGQNPPGSPFPPDSANPSISADGRFVSFQSQASNLVPNDTNSSAFNDVFLRDRQTGTTIRASVSTTGQEGNGTSNNSSLSDDGQRVVFGSEADTLVAGDANGKRSDVFLHEVGPPLPPAPDTTPPETTITSGPSGETTSTTATFHFTSSESSSSFECSLDGAAFASCSSPKTYTGLALGEHTFTVRASDAAGNTDPTPAQRTWTVTPDTTPPETTITSGPSGEVTSTTATFEFTSSESPSSFECSLDGAAFEACSSPKTYTGLTSGEHTFGVKATNAAGNTDTTPAQRTWRVSSCTIVGTEGADRLTGTSGDDFICVLGGNDEVAASGGNDTVVGGSGDDKLFGGIGADTLRGGVGRDELNGDDGNDALFGEEGFDKLNGGAGTDSCEVGPDGGETANCE
jgi:hypothetical protein